MKNKTFQRDKVLTISFGHLAHDTYSSFLGPLLPELISKLGISLVAAGFLDVIRRIPSILTPLVGFIADSVSLKYLTILTPSLTAICMSLLGIAPNYMVLALLLFVTGISAALFHIPSPVIISRVSGKKVSTGMGFYMFGGEMARTLGPLLITAAVSYWGLEGSVRVMPLGFIASALLYIKLKDFDFSNKDRQKKDLESVKITFKKLLPFFFKIFIFLAFGAGLKIALTVFLTTFLIHEGDSFWQAGINLSILQLSGAFSTIFAGMLAEKISCRNTLLISSLGTPLMMIFFINFPEYRILSLTLLGMFIFIPGPVILTMVQKSSFERPAFVNSVYMTINFSISAVMAMLVGYVGDITSLAKTYEIFTWVSLLAIPVVFMFKSGNESSSIR